MHPWAILAALERLKAEVDGRDPDGPCDGPTLARLRTIVEQFELLRNFDVRKNGKRL